MTEIKTRPLKHYECYSLAADDFTVYIANGNRILDVGDRPVFVGHNGQHIEMQVIDRGGHMRWLAVDETLVFVNAKNSK